jgi:hypothetical protein
MQHVEAGQLGRAQRLPAWLSDSTMLLESGVQTMLHRPVEVAPHQ